MPEVVIRPMRPEDVEAADRVGWGALSTVIPEEHQADEAVRAPRGRARVAHFQRTDPEGAWVAEADGEVVGVALSLVREGIWGLSLLGVSPALHAGGVGGRLLRAALVTAEGTRGGIILSSQHPAAMRSYARAGFDLRPSVCLAGMLDRAKLPAGLTAREADLATDRELIDAVGREIRGASYGEDLEAMAAVGATLLVVDGKGFAAARDGSPVLVAARDDDAATDLLLSCFARAANGATVSADFITAGNDWAVRAGLDLGLSLTPDGPVFVRGELGALRPFLPSGVFL